MSTGPTMGELTEFIEEHLPNGFSLKLAFTARDGADVRLYARDDGAAEPLCTEPGDLPAVVVRRVNAARGLVNLEPVEGTWGQR